MSSDRQNETARPGGPVKAAAVRWDDATRESVRIHWTDILIALVRSYEGKRMTMWERIPNMMTAAARQTVTLDAWFTQVLRSLQIPDPGPAKRQDGSSSLSSIWDGARSAFRGLCPGMPNGITQAERRALRLLTDEIMTIVAEARLRWDGIKTEAAAKRAAREQD
jgi:hypothetical protein